MTLDEYIQKLEAAQKVLPDMISVAAKNATIRAVEAAQEKTPPTADSLSGINTRTGELKQHWATDSKIIPEQQAGQYVTELNNNKEYASFVNDGHRMDKHFVPGAIFDFTCPHCGSRDYLKNDDGNRNKFCGQCGKALDWEEV